MGYRCGGANVESSAPLVVHARGENGFHALAKGLLNMSYKF